MHKPPNAIEVYLQPGEWFFGGPDVRVTTVLGSCISITLWHSRRRIGGMCHFMLPKRQSAYAGPLDGRYGDEAMRLLLDRIDASGTRAGDYEVKLFGGGNMFPGHRRAAGHNVSQRNIAAAKRLIAANGFSLVAAHIGGDGHRRILFDLWNGLVWHRQSAPLINGPR